jgi:photosynthetic reaction center H subunit
MMPDDTVIERSSADGGEVPIRIEPLSELRDYEVADGYPEIRGWEVRDTAHRAIGRVHDLLVDVEALRVRYLDVELGSKFAKTEADRRVLIPVEKVDLDGTGDQVLLPGIDVADVRTLVPHARRGVMLQADARPADSAEVRP